jgi:hypothetical protein
LALLLLLLAALQIGAQGRGNPFGALALLRRTGFRLVCHA